MNPPYGHRNHHHPGTRADQLPPARESARPFSLRAFTSGRRVSYERFNAELDMLFSEAGFDAYDDLKTVQTYAENTSDPVWTDLDTGSGDS
ncbi:hypothetical protein [Mycolicibacterium fortuitum]|uniref:hypothetical protein n=1 Tax=Mycolicibacterium fortuitum TaxID=1766 RepID=UPI002636C100|nr:hypothetical protein [Mycolicibacterium fortuitum]